MCNHKNLKIEEGGWIKIVTCADCGVYLDSGLKGGVTITEGQKHREER